MDCAKWTKHFHYSIRFNDKSNLCFYTKWWVWRYVLTWTISNSPCTSSTSNVTLTFGSSSSFLWTGTVDNDWNTAGNWICGTLPTLTDDVTIPSSSNVTISSSSIVK